MAKLKKKQKPEKLDCIKINFLGGGGRKDWEFGINICKLVNILIGLINYKILLDRASRIAQLVKNPPAMQETPVQFLGRDDLLKKGQATHSSILGLPLWLIW